MRPCRTPLLSGWLVVVILRVMPAASAEARVYGRLGGEVVLTQNTVPATEKITSIIWKHQGNLAMQWIGEIFRAFRQFEERGSLNTSTGVMTIRGLVPDDSGLYTPEINNREGIPIHLEVISDVPVPTLKPCNITENTCRFVCEGDTAGAGEVTYTWKADDTEVEGVSGSVYIIQDSSDIKEIKEFSCELSNQFSRNSSNSVPNPFTTASTEFEFKPNIPTGVTVLICLLLLVVLLALFHRMKTGVFFYEKASMPWEADFWRRNERFQRDAESNGTTRNQPIDETDEGTPMK